MPVLKIMPGSGLRVASPALLLLGGVTAAGPGYGEIRAAVKAALPPGDAEAALSGAAEGFVTTGGRFVTGPAALSAALWCGQMEKGAGASPDTLAPGDPVAYAARETGKAEPHGKA